jgi:hypothetical protein
MPLLGGRYAPITDCIGFVEADFRAVVEADTRWRASLGGYVGRPLDGTLAELLDGLLQLTGPLRRHLWVETTGRWTAYFDNFVNGSDPFPPVSYLCQQLKCRGVKVGYREPTEKRGGAATFSLYGPEPTAFLNIVRELAAVQEDRWTWSAAGTPQPFEDESAYSRRRIRDRLTADMLAAYSQALGIRPFDETFFGTAGHLVENENVRGTIRTETLTEARAMHGLS